MNRTMLARGAAAAVAVALFGAQPAPAQQRLVSAANPETVRALFQRWGYRPEELIGQDDQPLFRATIEGVENVVVFGGCRSGRRCSHIVLIATYDDVPNPPYEWLNRQNFDYNLVTVMRREDGLLTLRTGIMLGSAGIPESAIRAALDDWIAANDEISGRADQAGLAVD